MRLETRRHLLLTLVRGTVPVPAAMAVAAAAPPAPIVVGLVGAGEIGKSLGRGALLAVEQINAAGGILGRPLELRQVMLSLPDNNLRAQTTKIAAALTAAPGIVAVIGHDSPADAFPASIAYQRMDVLFISPTISYSDLTRHGLSNVFATLPDNADINRQTARFSFDLGLRRAVVIRSRSPDAVEQSLAYRDEAAVLSMEIVDERSFLGVQLDPQKALAGLEGKRFDALVLAGSHDEVVALIRHADVLQLPVICVLTAVSDPRRIKAALDGIRTRVLMPVLRNKSVATPEQRVWQRKFLDRFGQDDDDWAVQGYDAVGIVRDALVSTGASSQTALLSYLHLEYGGYGVAGRYSFNRFGRIYTRLLSFAEVRQEEIAYYSPGS